jgi:hypothetical protein
MLAYFPMPYPDELLSSVIARYGVHTGQDQQKSILDDLFRSKTVAAVTDLPSHLDSLVKNTKNIWLTSSDDVIQNNTLAPYYFPFINADKVDLITQSMKSDYGGNIHTRAGLVASSIKQPLYLRHCPKCLETQKIEFGETYWRRSHQIPEIRVCPDHSTYLVSTQTFFHQKSKHLYVAAPRELADNYHPGKESSPKEQSIANKAVQLLTADAERHFTSWQWTQFYRFIAKEHGMILGSRVRHEDVFRKVTSYWQGEQLLCQLEDLHKDNSWLVNIFRKHRKSFHPLRHMMVWEAFIPEWSGSKILDRVASYPKNADKGKIISPKSGKKVVDINAYREQWKKLVSTYPEDGVKKIRKDLGGGPVYAWLYRNDRQWLQDNTPDRIIPDAKKKIDWDEKDKNIRIKLGIVLTYIKADLPKQRITSSFLLQKLPTYTSLQKYLKKMPLTSEWLLENSESIENYQIRRMKIAAASLRSSGQEVCAWKIIRKAGLRKEKLTAKEITILKELEGSNSSVR